VLEAPDLGPKACFTYFQAEEPDHSRRLTRQFK
jgi:hypothetical protein